jgi:hypothetical protein
MRKPGLVIALCVVAAPLALGVPHLEISVSAWQQATCDFLTGGGFIYPTGTPMGGKGTFGVAGGCKNGSFWGHLEYHDHGIGVKVHGTKITGYMVDNSVFPDPFARLICGTGKTDYGDVTFVVRAKDGGCNNDEFDIQVQGAINYTTFVNGPHKLADGSIQLHKPNYCSTGVFGGSCPPVVTVPPGPEAQAPDVSVLKTAEMAMVPVGSQATYNIMVMAGGTGNSANVMLNDPLPPRPVGSSWTLTGTDANSCNITSNILNCNFGTMAAGTSRSISVSTTVVVSDAGVGFDNTATVTATVDTNPTNNASGPVHITVPIPE